MHPLDTNAGWRATVATHGAMLAALWGLYAAGAADRHWFLLTVLLLASALWLGLVRVWVLWRRLHREDVP